MRDNLGKFLKGHVTNKPFKKKKCKMCGDKFLTKMYTQKYCGSYTKKDGCAWKNHNIDKRWGNTKRKCITCNKTFKVSRINRKICDVCKSPQPIIEEKVFKKEISEKALSFINKIIEMTTKNKPRIIEPIFTLKADGKKRTILKKKKCLLCTCLFTPIRIDQKFCGSKTVKGSCSYIVRSKKLKM